MDGSGPTTVFAAHQNLRFSVVHDMLGSVGDAPDVVLHNDGGGGLEIQHVGPGYRRSEFAVPGVGR